eukprot:3028558-Rhodomonas_salina.3
MLVSRRLWAATGSATDSAPHLPRERNSQHSPVLRPTVTNPSRIWYPPPMWEDPVEGREDHSDEARVSQITYSLNVSQDPARPVRSLLLAPHPR